MEILCVFCDEYTLYITSVRVYISNYEILVDITRKCGKCEEEFIRECCKLVA